MKPLIFLRQLLTFMVAPLLVVLAVCVVLLWPKIFSVGQRLGDLLSSYLF